jgi:lipoprotein-anchoring transpeptidase ErfK/SrfK
MMQNKQNVTKTWLPLIFATVLNSGVVMAEPDAPQALVIPPLQQEPTASAPNVTVPAQEPVSAPVVQPVTQQSGVAGTVGADQQFAPLLAKLAQRFPDYSTAQVLIVDAAAQKMLLVENGKQVGEWVISTAEKGIGSTKGSDQTPLGAHRIAEKIGAGAALGTIFKSRQNTGQLVEILTAPNADSPDDYVTSRIMWLDGLEPGVNKGGNVDSHERFIYIHGTGEEGRLGKPASHGCIRMRNKDVMDLFDRVRENTLVYITDGKVGP